MRTSPSIAPHGPEQDTYLVLDDFGRIGRAWRATDEDATDRKTLMTVDIADELRRRLVEYDEISESVLAFLEANRR